jgi:DNA-binding NarL/FixJ family response regulator
MWSEYATGRDDDWDEPEPEDETEYEYCVKCGWIAESQVHEEDCRVTDIPPEPVETPRKAPAREQHLTPRELEIARLVALGWRNGVIAGELGISTVTVKNHIARIMKKLDANSRMDIMLWIIGREGVAA